MTLEEIEKILKGAGLSKTEMVKLTVTLDKPVKTKKGELVIMEGVPGELLEFIKPNKYVVLVKAWSLKAYVKKRKELEKSMTKTHAEFLEELRADLTDNLTHEDLHDYCVYMLDKIEQFQAEANHENK